MVTPQAVPESRGAEGNSRMVPTGQTTFPELPRLEESIGDLS
jgi:hypothetical protein